MESKDIKLVAVVGMCGSGKSTAVDYLTERNIPKVYFGGVVLNAVKEAGLEVNPENEKKIREAKEIVDAKTAESSSMLAKSASSSMAFIAGPSTRFSAKSFRTK